jgi:hypothetical protein
MLLQIPLSEIGDSDVFKVCRLAQVGSNGLTKMPAESGRQFPISPPVVSFSRMMRVLPRSPIAPGN